MPTSQSAGTATSVERPNLQSAGSVKPVQRPTLQKLGAKRTAESGWNEPAKPAAEGHAWSPRPENKVSTFQIHSSDHYL